MDCFASGDLIAEALPTAIDAQLLAEGRVVGGSDVDLARVPLGVGVRAGTPVQISAR